MDGRMWIPELEHEASVTRKTLERVPFERADWKPHDKSYALGELASHLANIPGWTPMTVNEDGFTVDDSWVPFEAKSRDELLAHFDENVAQAKSALEAVSGEELMEEWTMRSGDEVVFTMPKAVVLRSFVFSHMVHHRAQLGVYLRLLDVPVPAMYGPSADEEM